MIYDSSFDEDPEYCDYNSLPPLPRKKVSSKEIGVDTMDLLNESEQFFDHNNNMETMDVGEDYVSSIPETRQVDKASVSGQFSPDPRLDVSRKSRNVVKKPLPSSPLDNVPISNNPESGQDLNPSIPYWPPFLMNNNLPYPMNPFQVQNPWPWANNFGTPNCSNCCKGKGANNHKQKPNTVKQVPGLLPKGMQFFYIYFF
jgi:hypothetical protein